MDEQMMRETLGEQEPESFEELIAGRYHGDFTRKVQQLMDRRFAEHRQKEEQWAQWLPAVEKLCADRGLDPADAEGLTALLEKEAGARSAGRPFGNGGLPDHAPVAGGGLGPGGKIPGL